MIVDDLTLRACSCMSLVMAPQSMHSSAGHWLPVAVLHVTPRKAPLPQTEHITSQ